MRNGDFRSRFLAFLVAVAGFANAEEPLHVGDAARDFTVSYATKDTIINKGFTLSSRLGKNTLVLAFYPADWSGGCTKEMCMLRDNFLALGDLAAEVYGISGDYVYSHREWARHLDIPFPLLSDHDHAVARAYASYNEMTGYNRRAVYVIDKSGKITYIDLEYRVSSDDSFKKLISALKTSQ